MWMIILFLSKIINTIFPSVCYGCGQENFILCEDCLKRCAKALDTPALYITSTYSFKDPLIKRAIHAIKYYHRQDLIEPLTRELAKELTVSTRQELINSDFILVPIPMPWLRKYLRGYNQAEIITRELSKKISLPYKNNLLKRTRNPKHQVKTTTRGERLHNQKNSYQVMGDVRGLKIILVDDVSTTGATLYEARKTLLKAGAAKVRAVTLAH